MAVTEVITKNDSRSYIEQLMKKFISNRSCLGLLRFFAAHPNGRFSKLAVIHALDYECYRWEVEQGLEEMVEKEILIVSGDNSCVFYTLTREEMLRRLIMSMAEFDCRDWQLVLEEA